jgi:hypothetical protein
MRLVRLSGMVGAALAAIFALAALPATAGAPSFGFGSRSGGPAQAPACVPVPAAVCGSVRVPLFRSKPAGPTIDIRYALIRHRDPAVSAARGTVVLNPGGPGDDVIRNAANWTERLADVNIGQLPAIVRAALQGQNRPLITTARALMALKRIASPRWTARPRLGGLDPVQ